MADRTFNDVKINLTLKPQAERANVSSSQEDLAVQMGKIQQWYPGLNNYATCATAAGTAIKTVDCPGFELTTGTVVIVKFTVTNTAAVADLQLNVNETGAKGIKYRNANLSAASVLTANRIYAMLYDGTYWQIIGDLDTNSNTYDRTSVQTRIYAGAKGVFPYSLCAMDTAQRMQAFTTTGGTGTSKAFNSSEKFLYPPVIMYHSANSTIANGSVIANNALYEQYPSVNMQYNANVTSTSAYSQYKPLYIECAFDSDGYWSPTGITQTFTSGKYYILLGCMYNTSIYQLALFAQHPLYYYDGTNLIDGESHLQDGRYIPMTGSYDIYGNLGFNGTNHGYYLKDSTGLAFPGIYYNSTDFWIGATQKTTTHFTGRTMISTGYNSESGKGNTSIWVYIPNSTNTGSFGYEVFNSTNLVTGAGITISTADHQLFNGAVYTIKHSNSVTARTDYMQPYVKYDAQGHITGSSYWMASAKGSGGVAGWIKVATIKHKMHYDNTPFLLDIAQRGNTISYRIHIRWNSVDDVDPSLGEFLIASDHAWESIQPRAYIIKSATSTWDLYILKLDSYEAIAMRLQPGRYFDDHTEWTWKDEQTASSAITGGTEATKKIYSTTDHTHDSLTSKTLTKTTLEGTAGNFFFKGDNLLGGINDWVGIQADAGNDKFQLIANSNNLLFRQNDSGGTNTANWQAWNYLMTPGCVTGENGITATINEGAIGSGDSRTPINIGVKIGHSNSVTAVTTASLLKIKYDAQGHITGSAAVVKGDIPALDYVPNTNAGVNAAINLLPIGADDPVDDDYYIAQYANGGTTHTTYYRRPASKLYNYIYEKLQHDNAMNISHTFDAWNTVGWHRALSLPCSATASGKMIRTLELTAARTYNNAQPEIFSVRLIGLYNTTEGFEILYSKSNTAATQLMTKVRMTKSSDGKTLYVDIYYNSTTSNTLTVFCTLIDPYNGNATSGGSSLIIWENGAVVDDSLTVVASLDIPRDITAPGTGFYYVIGTQNASTASWTGAIPASKLHNGLTIAYYLPYASVASTNVTLNLTLSTGETTGAINVYYTGPYRMTTHYDAGSTIILTYFEAGAISVGGTATTDARWTHSDYNTNTNTYVKQSSTTTENYRALMLGQNNSTTPSDLTTTVTNQVYATANLYTQPSTGNLYMAGKCFVGTSSQSSYPTGGIHVHDVRNLTVTPDVAVDRSANFYFHQYKCDGTNNYWWSILNVRGWTDTYSSWELAGPSSNADQRTTPLYVRTSNTNSAWGNWRKIYDTANPPTYSEVGAASSSHTHSSLNVGNVGNSNTPVYFSNGAPTAVTIPASGAWWSSEPHIDSSGVLEIGRYIDFHATNTSTNNYDVRLDASTTNMVTLNSASGSTTLRIAGTLPMLRFQQTTSGKAFDNTSCGIWCRPADTNGVNMFMQSGGCIMIGAGEFASGAYSRKDSTGTTQTGYDNIDSSTGERLYLGADGEVQIISNGQNIATYSNNDHRVWKFNTSGQLITPGFIADTLDLQHTMLQQNLRSASNCVTLAEWIVEGAASTTYRPGISFFNMGGDSTDKGAIILRPYHHNTDPWASGHPVGLYIGKNMLSLDGVNVALQNAESLNTMINALSTGSSAPVDADYYVAQYAGGGTTTTTYHRRPVSALYSYIRSKHIKSAIAVQTGSSKKAKITLQTLMTWLITTKKYIPSGTTEDIIIKTTWAYANNDILRFNANGVDYEMSLAGVIIEFKGLATSYNSGEFTLTITSAPAVLSDTPTSGYTRFPANTTTVYHCNGSGYSPTWTVNMNKAVQTLLYSSTSSAGYGYADIVIGAVFSNWTLLLLEFMEASYGYSNENPHSGSGLIPLSLVRSLGNVSDISQQYQIPIGYNPGNTTANQYISVVYTDESTFRLSRGGSGGPLGKVKIYGIC